MYYRPPVLIIDHAYIVHRWIIDQAILYITVTWKLCTIPCNTVWCTVHAHQFQFNHIIGMEVISNTSFTIIKNHFISTTIKTTCLSTDLYFQPFCRPKRITGLLWLEHGWVHECCICQSCEHRQATNPSCQPEVFHPSLQLWRTIKVTLIWFHRWQHYFWGNLSPSSSVKQRESFVHRNTDLLHKVHGKVYYNIVSGVYKSCKIDKISS